MSRRISRLGYQSALAEATPLSVDGSRHSCHATLLRCFHGSVEQASLAAARLAGHCRRRRFRSRRATVRLIGVAAKSRSSPPCRRNAPVDDKQRFYMSAQLKFAASA